MRDTTSRETLDLRPCRISINLGMDQDAASYAFVCGPAPCSSFVSNARRRDERRSGGVEFTPGGSVHLRAQQITLLRDGWRSFVASVFDDARNPA